MQCIVLVRLYVCGMSVCIFFLLSVGCVHFLACAHASEHTTESECVIKQMARAHQRDSSSISITIFLSFTFFFRNNDNSPLITLSNGNWIKKYT